MEERRWREDGEKGGGEGLSKVTIVPSNLVLHSVTCTRHGLLISVFLDFLHHHTYSQSLSQLNLHVASPSPASRQLAMDGQASSTASPPGGITNQSGGKWWARQAIQRLILALTLTAVSLTCSEHSLIQDQNAIVLWWTHCTCSSYTNKNLLQNLILCCRMHPTSPQPPSTPQPPSLPASISSPASSPGFTSPQPPLSAQHS